MSHAQVISIANRLIALNKRLYRKRTYLADNKGAIIDILLIRAEMAGLCSAMVVVCAPAVVTLSHPDEWHEVKLAQYRKNYDKAD